MRNPKAPSATDGLDTKRVNLYRSLVYNNIESFLASSFPQVKARMRDRRWHKTIRDFIRSGQTTTPIFHELPGCFVLWLSEEALGNSELDRMLEQLAHFAWVRHALDFAPDEKPDHIDSNGDLLQGNPRWSSLAWPLHYDWRIHDVMPEKPVAKESVHLLAWRDTNDKVQWKEVGPATVMLADSIREADGKVSGGQLLQQLAEALPEADAQMVRSEGHNTLLWLKEHQLVLGTATA